MYQTTVSFCLLGMYQQARLNYPTTLESDTEVYQINAQIVEVQKHSLKILRLKYCLKLTKISIFPCFALHAFYFLCSLQITTRIILPESENSQWQNQQQKAYELIKIQASLEGHTSKASRAIKCGRLMTPLESKSPNNQQQWQCSLVIPETCLRTETFCSHILEW